MSQRIRAVALCLGITAVALLGTAAANARYGQGSIVGWGQQVVGGDLSAGFVAVAAGEYVSLGLKADGSVVAWGYNDCGQCNVEAPNTGFIAVVAGAQHNLGLKADGSIVVWGGASSEPPAPNTGFVAVATGYYHSLGLKADGSIVAWGINYYGECDVPAPNAGFVALAATQYYTSAPSRLISWVQPAELNSGVGGGELPVDRRPGYVPVLLPAGHGGHQSRLVGNAAAHALP